LLTDHDSTNGTYVDGERIAGDHPLPVGASELRFGGVKMIFRTIGATSNANETSTRAVVGVSSQSSRKKR
jgi:pSer/pThr/pTyr-binding forkhead associated (FHA) protein